MSSSSCYVKILDLTHDDISPFITNTLIYLMPMKGVCLSITNISAVQIYSLCKLQVHSYYVICTKQVGVAVMLLFRRYLTQISAGDLAKLAEDFCGFIESEYAASVQVLSCSLFMIIFPYHL